MDYWYLGMLAIVVIVGIIYISRRGSTRKTIQDRGTISEVPVLFGDTGWRLLQSGKFLIQQNELVIVDDNNTEQLRMPINPSLQIALRGYSPFDLPVWDIVDGSGRTHRLKFKPFSFSMFSVANEVANINERLVQTIDQIAGVEIVRVSALAQPSLMRSFRFVPWVILTIVFLILIFVVYRGY